MVIEGKQNLEDHKQGKKVLDDEEFQRLTKSIPLWEKALAERLSKPLSDEEVDAIIERIKNPVTQFYDHGDL